MSEPNRSRFHHLKERLAHLVAPFKTFARRRSTFGRLQQRHRDLLDRGTKVPADEIRAYIEEAVAASKEIADPVQRAQLRADLRYWADVLHARSQNYVYPNVDLLPAAARPQGDNLIVIILIAIVAMFFILTRTPTSTPIETPTGGPQLPTPTLLPAPQLLRPEDGTVFGSLDFVELAWRWPYKLQPRYVFVVGMRHESEPDMQSLAWTRETTYGVTLPTSQPGVYYWVVGVSELSQDQNTWTRVSLPSEIRSFVWFPFADPGGEDGNGPSHTRVPPPPP